jgi:AhpD family alkylhydroperoxidase
MSRSDTEREIEQLLGQVPEMFKSLPDDVLAHEWEYFKSFQMSDTTLSVKEKHLIGYGVASATYCPYCTYFHETIARDMGASEQELEEAGRIAAETRKWSTYLHARELDLDQFKKQTDEISEFGRKNAGRRAA